MTSRATNKSHYTDGLEDPAKDWLQRVVTVKSHPEWGTARVMRWFPAADGQPARLRILSEGAKAQKVVPVTDIEILA